MRIYSFGWSNTGCHWIRIRTPFEELKKNHFTAIADGKTPYSLKGWDIVIMSNLMGDVMKVENGKEKMVEIEEMIESFKKNGARIVYDTDDLQDKIHKGVQKHERYDEVKGSFNVLLENADLITVTTSKLKKELSKRTDKPILVLPNCINPGEFSKRKGGNDKVKIAYAGSPSHILDAPIAMPALYNLREKGKIQFETFGFEASYKDWKAKQKKSVPIAEYYQGLAEMNADIGICPLRDTLFNSCKSPLKFLEYVSVGTMCLASNRLPYKGEMKPEWLVEDDKWEETLEKFINNPKLRAKTLKEQQEWVKDNRDIRKEYKRWERAYKKLLKGGFVKDKGKVTIVIPCYNYGKYLIETLMSCFTQTYQNLEIIVVDDGSKDDTKEISKMVIDPRFKYIYQKNKGLSGARNTGIRKATGEYILTLDADDTIPPEFVEKMMEKVGEGVGLVGANYIEFGESNRGFTFPHIKDAHQIRFSNQNTACSLVPKKVYEDVGGYDENMKKGYEDWDCWQRILGAGYKFARANAYFNYRIHSDSMINGTRKHHDEIVDYMREKNKKIYELRTYEKMD